jgi:hypothetical protein
MQIRTSACTNKKSTFELIPSFLVCKSFSFDDSDSWPKDATP